MKMRKESEIQKLTLEWIFKRILKKNGLVFSKVILKYKDKDVRDKYSPDIIGIDRNGILYVVECKKGELLRPAQGFGQLLLYSKLIKTDFSGFKKQIKNKKPCRLCRKKINECDWPRYTNKIDPNKKMRLILAVGQGCELRNNFLGDFVKYFEHWSENSLIAL